MNFSSSTPQQTGRSGEIRIAEEEIRGFFGGNELVGTVRLNYDVVFPFNPV